MKTLRESLHFSYVEKLTGRELLDFLNVVNYEAIELEIAEFEISVWNIIQKEEKWEVYFRMYDIVDEEGEDVEAKYMRFRSRKDEHGRVLNVKELSRAYFVEQAQVKNMI